MNNFENDEPSQIIKPKPKVLQEDDEKFAKIEAIHPTVQISPSLTKSDGQTKKVQAGVKAKPYASSQNLKFEINEESESHEN